MASYVTHRPDVDRLTGVIMATGHLTRRIAGVPRAVQLALHLCDRSLKARKPAPDRVNGRVAQAIDVWLDAPRGSGAVMPPSVRQMKHGMVIHAGEVFSTVTGMYRLDGASSSFVAVGTPAHDAVIAAGIAKLRSDLMLLGLEDADTVEISIDTRWWGDDVRVDGIEFGGFELPDALPGATSKTSWKAARYVMKAIGVARSDEIRDMADKAYDHLKNYAAAMHLPGGAVSVRPATIDLSKSILTDKPTHWDHTVRGIWHDRRPFVRSVRSGSAMPDWIPRPVEEILRIAFYNARTVRSLRCDPVLAEALGGVRHARRMLDAVGDWQRGQPMSHQRMPKSAMPDGVAGILDWMTLEYGLLAGRIRLGSGLTWTRQHLMLGDNSLPQDVLTALPGRPLTDVVEHRLLRPWTIVSVKRTGLGRIKVQVDAPDLELAQ